MNLIILAIQGLLIFGAFILLSKFMYFICIFNFIRVILTSIILLVSIPFALNSKWQEFFMCIGLLMEFIRKFYLYTQSRTFQNHKHHTNNIIGAIIAPIIFVVKGGIKISQYAVSVIDGTVSARQKLKRDKAEFENEKQAFRNKEAELNEEWENIKKAWDELIREREEFERQRDGNSYQKKDYSQNEGYRKSSSKTNTNQQERNKKSTGRYFKEWEKFDLDDFEKNDPYEVLGCNRNDSKETLKKAYKKLMLKWHSDTLGADKTASANKCREGKAIAQLINWSKDKLGLK